MAFDIQQHIQLMLHAQRRRILSGNSIDTHTYFRKILTANTDWRFITPSVRYSFQLHRKSLDGACSQIYGGSKRTVWEMAYLPPKSAFKLGQLLGVFISMWPRKPVVVDQTWKRVRKCERTHFT
jgi:hypothetical protein